jgi:hypothetical protein
MTFKNLPRIPRALLFMLRHDPAGWRRLRFWLRSLRSSSSPLADECPLITFGAADWLEQVLRRDMRVFEWGSGASTLYLARRVGELASVEHDPEWHRRIAAALEDHDITRCHYVLVEPGPPGSGARPDAGDPYVSTRRRYAGSSFERYVKAIDGYPDQHFDLVLVDGRQRVACGRRALPKIRPGGHLLLDNSERPEYEPLRRLLESYPVRDFFGVGPYQAKPWRTTVWEIR